MADEAPGLVYLRVRPLASLRAIGMRKYLDSLNEYVAAMLDPGPGVQ